MNGGERHRVALIGTIVAVELEAVGIAELIPQLRALSIARLACVQHALPPDSISKGINEELFPGA
ncbi:MAG: hypothetical protein RSE65_20770 [Hafnia sp.]